MEYHEDRSNSYSDSHKAENSASEVDILLINESGSKKL